MQVYRFFILLGTVNKFWRTVVANRVDLESRSELRGLKTVCRGWLQVEPERFYFCKFAFGRTVSRDFCNLRTVPIVPILEGQCETGKNNAEKYNHEDTADVVDTYAVALAVLRVAIFFLRVLLPPFVLEFLQFPFVQ